VDYFLTYLVLRLDYLSSVTFAIAIAFAIITILLAINQKNEGDFNLNTPWLKAAGVIFCIFMAFNVIIPTTKQAAIVYCLPKIVNNEQVQKIPDNLLKLTNSWIDEALSKTKKAIPKNQLIDTNATTN
jgi:hypothetical protein